MRRAERGGRDGRSPCRAILSAFLIAFFVLTSGGAAVALDPDEMLDDPALEARAQKLGSELRCVVCQSESIEISHAPLAHDMRVLVRERIKAGATDAEVKAFLVERYGDYVLMRPPIKPETYALWLAPIVLLGAGGLAAYFVLRGQARQGPLNDPDPAPTSRES